MIYVRSTNFIESSQIIKLHIPLDYVFDIINVILIISKWVNPTNKQVLIAHYTDLDGSCIITQSFWNILINSVSKYLPICITVSSGESTYNYR